MSKIRARNARGNPRTRVRDADRDARGCPATPGERGRSITVTAPFGGVYFERVRQDVVEHGAQPQRVTRRSRQDRLDRMLTVSAMRFSPACHSVRRNASATTSGTMDRFQVEPQLAGLDAGQIEKLVDGLGQLLDTDQ